MNLALWIVQGLLAALFVLGASFRFTMPMDELAAMTGLPAALIVFISICEILGGIGLIVPAVTRIKVGLVPLAAAGLTIIMIGATVLTALGVGGGDVVLAIFPLVIGILSAFVAYGRSQVRPHRQGARPAQTAQAVA
jgi:hypothetical protein